MIEILLLRHGNVHKFLVLLSVVSRVASEGEMDLNHSMLWSEDVAGAVEVYHAWRACLISRPLLALPAYGVVLLPRCGAADGDGKQQAFNTLAYSGRNVPCHRISQW